MKFLFRRCLICAAMMFTQNVFAQQYFFTNYTVDDGMSGTAVNYILKDHEGFLWLATNAGLNRFNGYDFTIYKSLDSDSSTLASNSVGNLLVDAAGNVWVGTTQGICLYNRKSNSFSRLNVCSEFMKLPVRYETFCLIEDSKKNIWAGVSYYGLVKYDNARHCFIQVTKEGAAPLTEMVTGIIEDKDSTLWLVNYSQLLHFNPVTKTVNEYKNLISADHSKFQGLNIFKDLYDEKFLWLVTWGSGLVHFNKLTGEFVSYKFHPHGTKNLHNIVFDIHEHTKNKLWLATNAGVVVFDYDKKIFEGFLHDSINQKPVINWETHSIYRDDEGVVWIGTAGGLCNIHPAKQNFVNQPLWLKAPIHEYYYDEADDKLYGVRYYFDRSVVIYDRKKNTEEKYKIPQADELRAEPFSLIKDNYGLIWIGTTKGIYTFDESQKKFSLFDIEAQLHIPSRSFFVRQALKDSIGNLWFSCYGKGLLMVDAGTKKITPYLYSDKGPVSFPIVRVSGIAAGRGKIIYACDDEDGALRLDYEKNEIVHFSVKEKKYSLLYNAADIAVDKSERIWVTTRNNGLVCIDKNNEAITYVKDEAGNIIDEQSTIALDDSGKIWLTANNGIYSFNPSTKSFTGYTRQDGLPWRTIPIHQLSGGKISFQVSQGIFRFDPLKVSKTSQPLNVHLTSLLVNGKVSDYNNVIDRLDTIVLRHTENNLTIEFAAIDFAYPASVLYSYKLEGIDHNWSAPSRTRAINFSQLPPGNFTLHIRAGKGFSAKKVFIQIVPAWWQTQWFRALVSFTIIAILFLSIRYYLSFRYRQKIAVLQRQQEIESIRMRISRDIHDEIGSGLTKIKLMSRNLSKSKEETALKETTAKISHASDELIQNLGEIVWTINPANDTLENVFGFVRNYVSKLFDGPDIKLTLNFTEPEKIPHVNVNPEVKRNLLLILKESLTNIFKHAHATEVSVALLADDLKIELHISDNGKGMGKEKQNGFGNGLKNMQKRAESINAEFGVDSGLDKGTTVWMVIPLIKS